MEFEDQDEREEQEEEEEEVEFLSNYDSFGNSSRPKMPSPVRVGLNARPRTHRKPRYRDCLKNHAVGIGGHAVDGCREFLAAGAESTLDALKCAACNCHRNFHRKEPESGGSAVEPFGFGGHHQYLHTHHHQLQTHHPHGQFSAPLYRTPSGHLHVAPQTRPLALPFTSGGGLRDEQEDVSNPNISGFSKKRSRTRFTLEQKEKMLSLAERLGWRIQKQDEEIVQQFCNEMGVKRRVLKVWMHNNRHTLGKKPYNSTENTTAS